jgi:hypothetical protein
MDFNQPIAHDIWVQSRQFTLTAKRGTAPNTLELVVTRPTNLTVIDGAVLTLSTTPISPSDYPTDGVQYTPSATWTDVLASTIDNSQVVGFWSSILGLPFPTGTISTDNVSASFTFVVDGVDQDKIYYASLHPCSNVLGYYPIGIQSYPIDSLQTERDPSTYTGSIPSLPSAPVSPTPGMVYFDQQLNTVQYWDSVHSVWIPTRADSILSGPINPGVPGQTYLLGGMQLKVFSGAAWVQATPTNFQLRVGAGWAPFTTVQASVELPSTPNVGDMVYSYTSQRIQYWDGSVWVQPTPTNTLFTGTSTIPAFTTAFSVEPVDMVTPYPGLLHYNTTSHTLYVWNGSAWLQANTDQQGLATSDKIGIGNDGTYEERIALINILKAQLGWPAICVELTEEQFNISIDNALDTYRQLSAGAYEQRFMLYTLMPDQSVYYLNSPTDRTDAIVSVNKIHRMNLYGVTGSGPDNTWGQAYAQSFYNSVGSGADMLSTYLVHQWSEDFSRIFAGDLPYVWNEARRELTLKRAIRTPEKVVLEVEIERTEQELLLDRWCKQWMQNWALAECKEYLGMIRSKYTSGTPGAAGTISLNGDTMLSEARQDMTELKEALLNWEYQNAEHGNISFLQA